MFLRNALHYKIWADRRTLDAVREADAPMHHTTIAFARQQLNHMVRVEELFRARLTQSAEPHQTTNTDVVPELTELDRRLDASSQWLLHYLNNATPESLGETIRFTFVDGQRGRLTREEIFFHVINHATYHRGAIGHALDLIQARRPADTYTVFIHADQPERRDN